MATQNPIHLDLASSSSKEQRKLVRRALNNGAAELDIGQGEVPWKVLADPAGNAFCVLEPRDEYRDTGAIAAIVIHTSDPLGMARFWSQTLGWPIADMDTDFVGLRSPDGVGPWLEFIKES